MAKDSFSTEQEIDEEYPDEMDEFVCPVCGDTFEDEGSRRGWVSLHPHMGEHSEEEKENAYRELGGDSLRQATITIWENR